MGTQTPATLMPSLEDSFTLPSLTKPNLSSATWPVTPTCCSVQLDFCGSRDFCHVSIPLMLAATSQPTPSTKSTTRSPTPALQRLSQAAISSSPTLTPPSSSSVTCTARCLSSTVQQDFCGTPIRRRATALTTSESRPAAAAVFI